MFSTEVGKRCARQGQFLGELGLPSEALNIDEFDKGAFGIICIPAYCYGANIGLAPREGLWLGNFVSQL